jgi:hypothetical protein
MRILQLVKGLSYFTPGMACRAEKGKPFEVEDGMAQTLMGTGKFVCMDAGGQPEEYADQAENGGTDSGENTDTEPDAGSGEEDSLTEKKIDGMKMPELVALAEEHGIDLSACANNEDRKALLKEILLAKDPFQSEE